MAEIKKYLDTAALSALVDQIKTADATVLASAKTYAEGLGTGYDVAGAAATVQGKLDEEVIRAKAAEAEAKAAAEQAQAEVDALELLVGTLPEGTTATSVVDYVNVKTAGIATDAALEELNRQLGGLQNTVKGITDDYLKSADKTELSGLITAEENRAKGVEGGLAERITDIEEDYLKAADKEELDGKIGGVAERVTDIEEDYLKAADKQELQGNIDLKADKTALDTEIDRASKAEAGLQSQINLIMDNPNTKDVIDSIAEFTAYVAEHGTIADGLRSDVNDNKKAIEDMDTAYKAADTAIKGRLDALELIDHNAYAGADTALKNELNAEIAKKANASDVATSVEALEKADSAMDERIEAIELVMGDGEGSVSDQIADAKQEAIDSAVATAAGDATTKANAAEAAAKAHADGLNSAMEARMVAVEGAKHTHDNKALLDTYTQTEVNLADAVAKKHEHSNAAVLNGITEDKVSLWDTVSSKASQDAFDELKGKVDTNTSAINSFTAITAAEVDALFA